MRHNRSELFSDGIEERMFISEFEYKLSKLLVGIVYFALIYGIIRILF